MEFKDWLIFEKNDLDKRIRSYPRFRFLVFSVMVFSFFISVFWTWEKTFSLRMKLIDTATAEFITQVKTPFLTNFFYLVSFLGSGYFIGLAFLILFLVLISKHRKRAATVAFLSLAGSVLLITFFKSFFGRARPFGCLDNGDCLAFPSGHTTLAFYFYGLLVYLIFRFLPISLKRFLLISFIIGILIILIAISRLFLQVHYLSDLLAGFFLGGTWLLAAIFLIDVLYSE